MANSNITKAYEILKNYNGSNNQILYYKSLYNSKKLILEDFGCDYILRNHDYEPIKVEKVVKISHELGESFKEKWGLASTPDRVYISTVIGEMGGSYHCYIKSKSVGTQLVYIKKRYILDKLVDIDYNAIDIDFDQFDNMPSNKGRKLKDHQKSGVKFLVANKKCVLADSMGTGKMQDVDTLTPTPDGYVRFGDLKIGDKIFGSDGKQHNVIGIFPHPQKDLYEIEFSDGTKTNSGLEHLWIVRDMDDSVNSDGWQVLSLQQILDRGLVCFGSEGDGYRFRIPVCEPVDYPEKELSIKPYELGVFIGSGGLSCLCSSSPKNTDTLRDDRHADEIMCLGLNVGDEFKFIPNEYKFGSIEQRKELLFGLMDSCGLVSETSGSATFQTSSESLAFDVSELVQSLGGLAVVESDSADCVDNAECYNVSMRIKFCPFKSSRNRDVYSSHEICGDTLVKSIKSVSFLRKSDAVCIKVDSGDESYLTNNYIVTHNTTTAIIGALAGGYKNILVITTASLKTTWKKDLVLYEDESNINIVSGSKWEPGSRFTVLNYDIVDNFYKIPEEPVFDVEVVTDKDGNVVETLRVPVMVKDKNTGKMVQKMQKSRKKIDIQKALSESPLFLEKYDCVIIDEAQKLSNNTSIRYKTIYDFLRKSNPKAIYLLTGTPLTNRPINLYHILKLIDADVTRDYQYYVKRYCGGKEMRLRDGRTIMTMGDATNLDELREKIKDVYIRRLASETGEMVDKTVLRRYYDLDTYERFEYDRLWQEYLDAQDLYKKCESEQYRQLVEGILVRQFLAKQMTKRTIELADDYIEQGEKVVIITCFQEEMDIIKEHYGKKCVTYNGSMTTKAKDKAQNEFMENPKVKVFVGQIEACGVGLSLQVSHVIIFNSYSWSEASNRQAEDRVYRLTQTKNVECIYMLFNDSVSQDMFDKVLYKGYIMDTIVKSETQKGEMK